VLNLLAEAACHIAGEILCCLFDGLFDVDSRDFSSAGVGGGSQQIAGRILFQEPAEPTSLWETCQGFWRLVCCPGPERWNMFLAAIGLWR